MYSVFACVRVYVYLYVCACVSVCVVCVSICMIVCVCVSVSVSVCVFDACLYSCACVKALRGVGVQAVIGRASIAATSIQTVDVCLRACTYCWSDRITCSYYVHYHNLDSYALKDIAQRLLHRRTCCFLVRLTGGAGEVTANAPAIGWGIFCIASNFEANLNRGVLLFQSRPNNTAN